MEVLGGVASIIAVIQISEDVLGLFGKYVSDVRDAKKDIENLSKEVTAIQEVMRQLEVIVEEKPQLLSQTEIKMLNNTIEQCDATLTDLHNRLKPTKRRRAMRRVGLRALKWPFKSGGVEKEIRTLERYKTTTNTIIAGVNMRLNLDTKRGIDV
jgi:chromosome segregation ATPase